MNNLLDRLQNESGYKAEEKKDILQKIAEWLKDIIEAIKDILNDGELNGAGKLFAKEKCDKQTKIRKMFLEAIDGATVNYREKGAVESETKLSKSSNKRLTNGKGKRYNKYSTHDEFTTYGMQWAYNPETKIGDTGYVFNVHTGKPCIIEATKKVLDLL